MSKGELNDMKHRRLHKNDNDCNVSCDKIQMFLLQWMQSLFSKKNFKNLILGSPTCQNTVEIGTDTALKFNPYLDLCIHNVHHECKLLFSVYKNWWDYTPPKIDCDHLLWIGNSPVQIRIKLLKNRNLVSISNIFGPIQGHLEPRPKKVIIIIVAYCSLMWSVMFAIVVFVYGFSYFLSGKVCAELIWMIILVECVYMWEWFLSPIPFSTLLFILVFFSIFFFISRFQCNHSFSFMAFLS